MNLKNFLEGIKIIASYYTRDDVYSLGSEHDEFFMYPTDTPIIPHDVNKLINLGWRQLGFNEDGGTYDPDETWIAYL